MNLFGFLAFLGCMIFIAFSEKFGFWRFLLAAFWFYVGYVFTDGTLESDTEAFYTGTFIFIGVLGTIYFQKKNQGKGFSFSFPKFKKRAKTGNHHIQSKKRIEDVYKKMEEGVTTEKEELEEKIKQLEKDKEALKEQLNKKDDTMESLPRMKYYKDQAKRANLKEREEILDLREKRIKEQNRRKW